VTSAATSSIRATLRILDDLGLVEDVLALPHTRMPRVTLETPSGPVTFADFSRLRPYGLIAFVPQWDFLAQWDFLDFLHAQATRYPTFRLLRQAEVRNLVVDEGRVLGVRAETPEGLLEVRADLVLAPDGRHSTLRNRAGLEVIADSPRIDVLWFRLAREPDDEVAFFRKEGNAC
jgi:2-polyprenyl-6-methoxyphenol hydroxylase-like FAD-dependent oxidoreductase